jgi:hypothetical protein
MRAVFVELPVFARHRVQYLDDDAYRLLQEWLMRAPDLGALMQGTGGLRKLRIGDARRGKGKRGGLRVIYFHWQVGRQFWLFTIYEKGEMDDLSPEQKVLFRNVLKTELRVRGIP